MLLEELRQCLGRQIDEITQVKQIDVNGLRNVHTQFQMYDASMPWITNENIPGALTSFARLRVRRERALV